MAATTVARPAGPACDAIVALAFWFLAPLPAPKVLSYTPLTHDRERKYPPLVTDGTRLYFMMPKKTGWTIAEVSASGGETAPIPSHFDDIQLADISPNGSELLIGQFDFAKGCAHLYFATACRLAATCGRHSRP